MSKDVPLGGVRRPVLSWNSMLSAQARVRRLKELQQRAVSFEDEQMTEGLNSYAGRKGLPVTFKVMMWREIAGNSALKFKKKKSKEFRGTELLHRHPQSWCRNLGVQIHIRNKQSRRPCRKGLNSNKLLKDMMGGQRREGFLQDPSKSYR